MYEIKRREAVKFSISVGSIVLTGCLNDQSGDENVNERETTNSSKLSNSDTDVYTSNCKIASEGVPKATESGPIKRDCVIDIADLDSATTDMYRIIIENTGEEIREFTIQIEYENTVVFDETAELKATKALKLTANSVGTYTTTIESESGRNTTITTVSDTDCDSQTTISFSNNGVISRNETYC